MAARPTPAGVLLVDKPAGVTSHDVVARVRRERGQKAGHAGTLDPFATGLLIVLLGRERRAAALLHGAAQDLPRDGAASAALDDRRPRRRDHRDRARFPSGSELPTGRDPPAGADVLGGQGRAASAPTGGRSAARRSRCPSARSTVHRVRAAAARGRQRRVRDRVLVGHLRAEPDRRPRRRLLRELRRTAIGPFRVEDATASRSSRRAGSCRAALDGRGERVHGPAGAVRPRPRGSPRARAPRRAGAASPSGAA